MGYNMFNDAPDIKLIPGYPMPRHQRLSLLKEWASGKRKGESDVIARIALDEIEELQLQITSLTMELRGVKNVKGS